MSGARKRSGSMYGKMLSAAILFAAALIAPGASFAEDPSLIRDRLPEVKDMPSWLKDRLANPKENPKDGPAARPGRIQPGTDGHAPGQDGNKPSGDAGKAEKKGPGIKLTWQAPRDVKAKGIAGYNVYRSEKVAGHYEKVNGAPVKDLYYEDRGLAQGKVYYYRVATVFAGGGESRSTDPVGMTMGTGEAYALPKITSFTSNALGKVLYLGEEAVFILSGDPGLQAAFDIEGVATAIPMKELEPGSYRGAYEVPAGARVRNATATASLSDGRGGVAVMKTAPAISFAGVGKPTLAGLYAGILESDRVGLNWKKQAEQNGFYNIYRDTARIVETAGKDPLSRNIGKGASAYIDYKVEPGAKYFYVLASFDQDGNLQAYTDNLEVDVPKAGHASGIETVDEDSGGNTLRPGSVLNVTVTTKPGGKAYFSLATAVRDREMQEVRPGVYKGSHTVAEGDGVFKARVGVSFKDPSGASHFTNSATFVSVEAPRMAASGAKGKKPLITSVRDDAAAVAGLSGKLVAGKTISVTLEGEPGDKAYFCVGDGIWKVPMKEEPGSPGVYKGQYTVRPGDSAGMSPDPLKKVYVTGYLEGPAGAVSEPAQAAAPVTIDTTVDIKVEVSAAAVPADAKSKAKVTFTVTDADGQPVANRRLTALLEPPPHYTGVVGGGGMEQGQPGLLGSLQLDFDDLTDNFGRVTATYTSGFAAKTAMIVARDFATGSVGMGYVTTSISSSVSLNLVSPAPGGGVVVAPDKPVYQLVIDVVPDPANPARTYPNFLLNAVPNVLTADGVSRANIIATLTQDGMPVKGKTILFAVGGAGGTLTASSGITDAAGRAQVFYIAGTRAGKALITATESVTGIYATTVITLFADAPAKIYAKAYPDTLPADGASTSRIVVELADINNNPTEGVRVNFSLKGAPASGSIPVSYALTDTRGACDFVYTAGMSPGAATIDILASSEPPKDDELKAALSRVIAPMVYDNYDFTETVVLEWYKNPGDQVGRGEPLALVGTPLGEMVVYAPLAGTLDRITVDKGINVMEGKEIGMMR